MDVFSSQERSLLLLRYLRYLRTFRGASWLLCFLSLAFLYFCDICHGCLKLTRKILVTFAIFAIFADISGPFLTSLLSFESITSCPDHKLVPVLPPKREHRHNLRQSRAYAMPRTHTNRFKNTFIPSMCT